MREGELCLETKKGTDKYNMENQGETPKSKYCTGHED